ncbi:mucin-associated surface protein (MASP), putative, partial [Trypanosoma cruzi]
MAMMMTGRVLLVCALCVLWCGAGGRCAEEMAGHDVQRDVSASGTPPLGSKELVTSPQETQELKVGPTDVNVKVPSAPSPSLEEDDDDDDDDDDDSDDSEEKQEKIKGPTQAQGGKNNKGTPESLPAPPPPPPPPPPPLLPSSTAGEESPLPNQESSQKITEVKENTQSESKMGSEAPAPPPRDAAQEQHSHDTDTENLTKNAAAGTPAETTTSSTSASGSGDHVQNKAGKDDAQSPEGQHDNLETGNTNVVPTLSEEAPRTAETITAARINGTANTQNSDGSTAVSHATSPLL